VRPPVSKARRVTGRLPGLPSAESCRVRVGSRPGTTTMWTCGRTTAERFDRSPLDEWAPTNAKHPAGDWRCPAGGDQRGRGQQSNQDNLPVGNLIVNALWAFAGPCYSPPRTERGRFSESSATKTSPLLRRFSNNSLGFVQAVKALWPGIGARFNKSTLPPSVPSRFVAEYQVRPRPRAPKAAWQF